MERRLFKLLTESCVSELEPDWRSVPEEPESCAAQTDEPQISDIFKYLSGLFNTRQFEDFYWIIAEMQGEFDAFMTNENTRAFGQIYIIATDEYKKHTVSFDAVKEIVNSEFNKRIIPKYKGAIATLALAVLLGKDKNWIYGVLERTAISQQIENDDYFLFYLPRYIKTRSSCPKRYGLFVLYGLFICLVGLEKPHKIFSQENWPCVARLEYGLIKIVWKRFYIMERIEFYNDEQALNWLTAICYMQEKHKYFMTDEDYNIFQEYISAERNNYNNGVYCFERAMQNISSMFIRICRAENKSWAIMLAEIAQDVDIDELLRICNMRIKFDKPKFRC